MHAVKWEAGQTGGRDSFYQASPGLVEHAPHCTIGAQMHTLAVMVAASHCKTCLDTRLSLVPGLYLFIKHTLQLLTQLNLDLSFFLLYLFTSFLPSLSYLL